MKFPDVQVDEQQMERLSNERFMPLSAFRIFRHTLYEPVEVHWHEFYELAFIVAGEGVHLFNGVIYPLTRGALFLLTPTDIHALWPNPGSTLELFNVIFSDAMLDEEVEPLLFRELADHHIQFPEAVWVQVEHEFRRLWTESNGQRAGRELVIHSTLQRLLIDVARNTLPTNGSKASLLARQQKLHKALIYLHHHFREPVTLHLIAQHVALSPNYFSECFRSATGVTFQRYLQSLRLRFSKSLLSVSSLPVTDICYAAGFQTLSHFERAFKREFGQAPTAWRALMDDHEHTSQNVTSKLGKTLESKAA